MALTRLVRLLLASTLLAAVVVAQSSYADASCVAHTLAISLEPGIVEKDYQLAVWLCGARADTTLVLTIAGGSYSHTYWDFPVKPQVYSTVRWFAQNQWSVISYDRIGIGKSSHPDSTYVGHYQHAWHVQQIITAARTGVFGTTFTRVVLLGHSLGTQIANYFIANYPGQADGLIATGMLNEFGGPASPSMLSAWTEANTQPPFITRTGPGYPLDNGYITTLPDMRAPLFFYLPKSEPLVVHTDETLKETVTWTEMYFGLQLTGVTAQIHVPSLVIVGQFDLLFCHDCTDADSALAHEPTYWSPDACLETAVISKVGHCIPLHKNGRSNLEVMGEWLNRRIGKSTLTPMPGCTAPGPSA